VQIVKTLFTSIALCAILSAEVHSFTLQEAVNTALKQNPDLILSRFDEQRARAAIKVAKDPFVPKVYGGSGLAYTSGYPNSIEGSAPSIVQVRTDMALYNRPKRFELREVRENLHGSEIETAAKADDIAYRTASLFLDAQQLERSVQSLEEEVQALERVSESVKLRVTEGRELPITAKRAELDLARERQRFQAASFDASYTEESLAVVLGFPAGDLVKPVAAELHMETPPGIEDCVRQAIDNNKEIQRMNSQIQAKTFEVKSYQAQRLPQFDLVAQYALFAKYNYQNYFTKFQRNNGQLGVSIRIPILIGSAPKGQQTQAEIDISKLRTQVNDVRNRTTVETRKSFQDVQRQQSATEVSRLDLDVAREQVRILLDQLQEGRTTRQSVDEARFTEQEKWITFYDAQYQLEKARLSLLKQMGTLRAALR
jgi:outer membrane protein TolC